MQCGRVGSRPLSTTEGSQGLAPWEPSLHLRPTPSPSLRREGSGMPKAGDKRVVQGACTFSWGLRVANDSRVVVCIRLLGRCLVSDCGSVPASDCRNRACAGPKVMLGRFSMTRLQPHVGRTPIIHYVLYIEKERYCSTAFQMARIYGERQLCIVRSLPRLVDCSTIS